MKKGFTLIELAIVMVIIGIILSSAIKATEIVKNARAKRILSQVTVLVDAQHQYYEKTGRYAGDLDNDGDIDYATLNSTAGTFANAAADPNINDSFNELRNLEIFGTEPNTTLASLSTGGPAYYACFTDPNNSYQYNMVVIRNVPCATAYQMELSLDKTQPDNNTSIGTGRVRFIAADNSSITLAGQWTATNLCPSVDQTTNIAYLFDRF